MRNENGSHTFQIAQFHDEIANRRAGNRVQSRGRLVIEDEPGSVSHRASDRDPSPLPAGKIGRHSIVVLCEAHKPQHASHPSAKFLFTRALVLAQAEADVLRHRQRIEERTLLEDHADHRPNPHEVGLLHAADIFAVDFDHAGLRLDQTQYELEDRRLPRAAPSENDLRSAGGDIERDVAKRVGIRTRIGVVDVPQRNDGCRHLQ